MLWARWAALVGGKERDTEPHGIQSGGGWTSCFTAPVLGFLEWCCWGVGCFGVGWTCEWRDSPSLVFFLSFFHFCFPESPSTSPITFSISFHLQRSPRDFEEKKK